MVNKVLLAIVLVIIAILAAVIVHFVGVTPPKTTTSTIAATTVATTKSTTVYTVSTPPPTTVGGAVYGTYCIPSPGYLCKNVTLKSNQLLFVFGQNSGTTFYNIQMACAATITPAGMPNGADFSPLVPSQLASGNTTHVSILCAGVSGTTNTTFNGHLWVNYTVQSSAPNSASNPYVTAQFASVSAKSS